MKTEELTYATRENIEHGSVMACYYCLATDIQEEEIDEYTGGRTSLAVCPRCSVDGVILKDGIYTFLRLMTMHIEGFHFAARVSNSGILEPNEPVSCNMGVCSKWNEYLAELKEGT